MPLCSNALNNVLYLFSLAGFFLHSVTASFCLQLQACVELLEEENIQIPSWICFGSVDGENAPSGESFKECFEILNKSKKVNAVGINCASPHFIEILVCKFKEVNSFKQQSDKS